MGEIETVLALDAYRRGHYAEALQHLLQISRPDCSCLQILDVAILGQLGRDAEAAIAELRRKQPKFEESFTADLARQSFTPSLISLLKVGLQKAGLRVA